MIIKRLRKFYLRRFKPIEYAKRIGVNFPEVGGDISMGILTGVLSRG